MTPTRTRPPPSWVEMKSDEPWATSIDWETLRKFAVAEKQRASTNETVDTACELSVTYSKGGLHIVRRLEFSDGDTWIVRVQKTPPSANSSQKLLHEIYTIGAIRRFSNVPIPKIIAYRTAEDSPVKAAFTIQEYLDADTAMHVLGEDFSRKNQMTAGWEERYYRSMASLQAEISSVRFPMIGCIVETNNVYSVGPIPGIGGPFESSADFFEQWAENAAFPYPKDTVENLTPPEYFKEVWHSITHFPSQVAKFAKSYNFMKGPFPVIHGDLYRSNILMDGECNIKAIIDWEYAIVAPWELVEFIKDLRVVPAALDGPVHVESPSKCEKCDKQKEYVEYVKETEDKQSFDNSLSQVLGNPAVQDFAQSFWLWGEGRAGFYTKIGIFQ